MNNGTTAEPIITKVEYFDDRVYKITENNQQFDIASVTTKLGIEAKSFLYKYYAELGWEQARKKLRDAGERGSRIHYAWYIYIKGGVVIYNPWQRPIFTEEQIKVISQENNGLISVLTNQDEMVAMQKLQKFHEEVKPEGIHAEMTVYDIKQKIAGTLDDAMLIEAGTYPVNGASGLIIPKTGIYLADLKNGNQVPESAWAQLATYTEAYESMGHGPVEGAIILHTSALTKKGIAGFSATLKSRDELRPHFEIYKHLSAVWDARNPNFAAIAFSFPSIIQRKKENIA